MTQTKDIIIPYRPHDKQRKFHESEAKFRLLCTGVGFGKTAGGANETLKWIVKRPSTYIIAAPTYKMLTLATLPEFFKWCPREIIANYNKSEQIIDFVNGARIICVAGDREDTIDRIRGITIGGGWGDEISQWPEYMHNILIARLRDPKGCLMLWYTTTPKGFTWMHRIFMEKKKKDGKVLPNPDDYEIFGGSYADNPHTPDEYKEHLKNTYVGVFAKQELHGEFVGFEGLVYPTFQRSVHVIDAKDMKLKQVVAGVDFGFTNPSVILLCGLDSDGRIYILKELYQSRITDADLADHAKSEYGEAETFYCDSENPSGITEFSRRGLHAIGILKREGERRENFVSWGIKLVSKRLEVQADGKPRLFVDKRCVNTIMEFENYRYPDQKEEKPEQESPLKIHDHTMDALRYIICSMEGMQEGISLLEDEDGLVWGSKEQEMQFGI